MAVSQVGQELSKAKKISKLRRYCKFCLIFGDYPTTTLGLYYFVLDSHGPDLATSSLRSAFPR